MKYVAFLRGINVGGNVKVSMEDLRKCFSSLGFTNVKTVLNSGNVMFEAAEKDETLLQKKIEQALLKQFGKPIKPLLRSRDELNQLIAKNPFKNIEVTKDTRLYVTFFSESHIKDKEEIERSAGSNANITSLTKREICSVITVTPTHNTTDMMGFLEKEFGKNVTTRNWNTLLRLVKD